jgi:hypothetical protein
MSGIPKSKGTLENFKDIVGTDDLRPVMMGVYVSEDGFIVGTDAHKLVKQKNNGLLSQTDYAGKIIDLTKYIKSKGKLIDFVDGVYPKYDAVIPRDTPYEDRALSTYAFYNYVKSALGVKRLVDAEIFNINFNLMTETSGETKMFSFAYHVLFDALNFAMLNGWDVFTLRYSEPTRAVVFDFGGDNIILVMPIIDSYGASGGSTGTIPLTTEEVEEKYRLGLTNQKASKPKASKPVRPSAPVSSEPFKAFKGDYDEDDTTYVLRKDIESITLTNGEVLGKNDVVHGFYRVNKKMATGGGIYSSDEMYVLKVYDLKGNLLDDSTRFRERNERRAKEHAIYYYEDDMRDKYGSDLMFTVELAKPKMAHGGSMYAGGGNLGKTGGKTYKLRAEGLNDFLAFLQNDMYFKIKYFTIEITGFPDVVVTFETNSSLSEIKQKLKEVPDSHVMLETVKPVNEYTGEREYAHGGSMYADGGLIAYANADMESEIGRFSSLAEAKKFAKANKWRYDSISFQDPNNDEILVSKEDSFQDIDWLFSGKMAHGGSVNGGKQIKLRELDSGKITTWTLSEIISRINEDNYDDNLAYDESDWQEGFKETLEGQFYSLYDKNGNPLNDNLIMAHGGTMTHSHEAGDKVTFKSVMGGTKTGLIVSKLGEDGFRIKTEDGFATVKKSAIV